jgi:tetratricopeptide (TPR) repeat protein
MKRTILTGILASFAGIAGLMAQQPQGAPPAQAAAPKGPAPKSQAELDAVRAMFNAADADAKIAAAEALVTKFADTDFKSTAYILEGQAYESKRDFIKAQIFYEHAVEADPKSFQATLAAGEVIVKHTGENDLDKEEKLAKGEKYLHETLDLIKTADKPNPSLTDAQWDEAKKQETAATEDDLGLSSLVRKKPDDAAAHFKTASEIDPSEPAHQARLAQAYLQAGKNDDAIAICDKVLANAQIHPQIKAFVTTVKEQATKAKGGK